MGKREGGRAGSWRKLTSSLWGMLSFRCPSARFLVGGWEWGSEAWTEVRAGEVALDRVKHRGDYEEPRMPGTVPGAGPILRKAW